MSVRSQTPSEDRRQADDFTADAVERGSMAAVRHKSAPTDGERAAEASIDQPGWWRLSFVRLAVVRIGIARAVRRLATVQRD